MSLREDADYADEYSKEGAEIAINNAEGLLKEAERNLKGSISKEEGRRLTNVFMVSMVRR